ncbi:LysR family transcriptional regulator [uncultured Roseobacter sp.]|uniref:LysR family transcriptional regulator n=1 Tax=uncultured Roseobacter sp. TaxID=114847 RepID=UPI0026340394|nr:LysR family transcriptional regulator [uncultured Roseobacter sp.]
MIGHLISLKQLEALIWVADLGSFRKAAQQLNTTQPNISARIAGLEETLGLVLMHRDAGSVRMTDKGSEILAVARRIVGEAETLTEIAGRADLSEGRLRLGVTELVAATWLHQYLRDLKATYPAISVELTVDMSRQLDAALGNHSIDLAIQNSPFVTAASGVIEIGQYPYVWAAEKSLAHALSSAKTLKDLMPHTLLTHARHTQSYIELSDHAQALGVPTTSFAPSSSLTSCMQMAADGLGVALLPRIMAERGAGADRLTLLHGPWLPSPLRFSARYDRDTAPRYVAQAASIAAATAQAFGHDPTPKG